MFISNDHICDLREANSTDGDGEEATWPRAYPREEWVVGCIPWRYYLRCVGCQKVVGTKSWISGNCLTSRQWPGQPTERARSEARLVLRGASIIISRSTMTFATYSSIQPEESAPEYMPSTTHRPGFWLDTMCSNHTGRLILEESDQVTGRLGLSAVSVRMLQINWIGHTPGLRSTAVSPITHIDTGPPVSAQ
ncbi:hypothetical protein LZ32DRAFT_99158 [Colletotrichum eremochloae]|nr:hypothetical protein LZ32DRAFT_99158 [Colletotrichum eremochloae]